MGETRGSQTSWADGGGQYVYVVEVCARGKSE